MDKELDALALASAMLQDNLRDKEAALTLDQRCVLLDGRINLQTPPPSSIASVSAHDTFTYSPQAPYKPFLLHYKGPPASTCITSCMYSQSV